MVSSVEKMVKTTSGWSGFSVIGQLPEPRQYHTMTFTGSKFYIIGGSVDGIGPRSDSMVESEDGATWTRSAIRLKTARVGHTAVTTEYLKCK